VNVFLWRCFLFCFFVGKVWYLLLESLKIVLCFTYSTRSMDNKFFVHQMWVNQNTAIYIVSFISDMSVSLHLYHRIGLFFRQARLLISNLTYFLLLSKMIQRVPLFHQNLISPVILLRQVHKFICKIEGGLIVLVLLAVPNAQHSQHVILTCVKTVNSKLCCLDRFCGYKK